MNGTATTQSEVQSTGQGIKQMVRSLRMSCFVDRIIDSNAVREIQELSPEERWKIFRDLESLFGARAEEIEKSYPLPK